jgi:hypothetical protein
MELLQQGSLGIGCVGTTDLSSANQLQLLGLGEDRTAPTVAGQIANYWVVFGMFFNRQ